MLCCTRECTLLLVAKQTELFDVVFRCDPCDRRHGHAPVLAAADEGAAGGWSFWVADRGGIRGRAVAVREAPDALARLYGTEPSTRLGFLPLSPRRRRTSPVAAARTARAWQRRDSSSWPSRRSPMAAKRSSSRPASAGRPARHRTGPRALRSAG